MKDLNSQDEAKGDEIETQKLKTNKSKTYYLYSLPFHILSLFPSFFYSILSLFPSLKKEQ